MKKHLIFGLAGFAIGVVIAAVAREVVLAFVEDPTPVVLGAAFRWLGTFRWLYDYQTFITGVAAVGAAFLSISAVRRQIEQVERIEADRREARRAANRGVLPLTLAALSKYAEANASLLEDLYGKTVRGVLPKSTDIPTFANLPSEIIAALKEMIETLDPGERGAFTRLLINMQIESSRLSGIEHSKRRDGIISANNIGGQLLGQAAIYARTAALYDFARSKTEHVTDTITKRQVASALFLVGVHEVREELVEMYKLDSDDVWDPYS